MDAFTASGHAGHFEALAEAIRTGNLCEKVLERSATISNFKNLVLHWKDSALNLNILQLAVLYCNHSVVEFLCQKCSSIFDPSHYVYDKSSSVKTIWNKNKMLLNAPLHLCCLVGDVALLKLFVEDYGLSLRDLSYVTILLKVDGSGKRILEKGNSVNKKKLYLPFQICVSMEYTNCIEYLINVIILPSNWPKDIFPQEPLSLLHKACYLGYLPLVELLLKQSYKDALNMHDKNGETPLHAAVWNGNPHVLQLLLESGADVNVLTDMKSCLHVLYLSRLHPRNYIKNTQLLLQFGIDVNITDKMGNTALHILASEVGSNFDHSNRYWKPLNCYIDCFTNWEKQDYEVLEIEFCHIIMECMKILLSAGIKFFNVNENSLSSNQTVLEILLLHCSYPSSKILQDCPELFYDMLQLFFQYNSNPNTLSQPEKKCAFIHFLMYLVNDIADTEMKEKFLLLFLMNGADPNQKVPEPRIYSILKYEWPDEEYYPVLISLKENHPISMVKMLCDFMSFPVLQKALKFFENMNSPLFHAPSSSGDTTFKKTWQHIMITNRLRALKHSCKVKILECIGRKGSTVQYLPLPQILKNYLTSPSC